MVFINVEGGGLKDFEIYLLWLEFYFLQSDFKVTLLRNAASFL